MDYENSDLANALRGLSIDMVEKANSGHPGLPLGMADVMLVLYRDFLQFNPCDSKWPGRDRFVLSAGHGSALLYSALYLCGYEDMDIEQLKQFRQMGSKTPGHPEYGITPGVETTTGPLGQGLANAVGMALAARISQARDENHPDHKVYVMVGDGCLMEGISQEAISFTGHMQLNNLIILFDDNGISIDGPTSLATSENHVDRFKACGFDVMSIDGHDYAQIQVALATAQHSKKPVMIACKTVIGYGSPNKAGSCKAHGAPLGEKEALATRQQLGLENAPFETPQNILDKWRSFSKRCLPSYKAWTSVKPPELNTDKILQCKKEWSNNHSAEATRKSSEYCLELFQDLMPNMIGGSADLTDSNFTKLSAQSVINAADFSGSYIHWGIREHGMAAMMNGIALYDNFIPYGGTFLVFTDYLRPALRLSALMGLQVIYLMTHDSIGVGEDGPTHQPVEHLASLRAIPELKVMRPCDRIETLECWQVAMQSGGPSLLSLSRQVTPVLRTDYDARNLSSFGAYVMHEYLAAEAGLEITIFASGTEVALGNEVALRLNKEFNKSVRLVSVPSFELFAMQSMEYKKHILCNDSKKVAIEAGCRQGWDSIIGPHGLFFGMDGFGKSAPAKELYKHFGMSVENIVQKLIGSI